MARGAAWKLLVIFLLVRVFSGAAGAESAFPSRDANALILSVLEAMPRGGGYSATMETTHRLQAAVQTQNGIMVEPEAARPSYCSGATYLVFLQALQRLETGSRLNQGVIHALAVQGQPDGVGVWGRWNANGPGTACLFHELNLGKNFTSFEDAQPGDFMKIFWTTAVGRHEHGHSVIFLGKSIDHGVEMIRFWSSNQPVGFGEKSVPRARIAYAIFSRLETPENIVHVLELAPRNPYLGGLIHRESSLTEALAESGVETLMVPK
ncbi:MAG TPA: hypothetical protein VGD78_21660 [Chthoniobacterales bacterium]